MNKLFTLATTLLLLLVTTSVVFGQTANNYLFSTSTGATLESFTTSNSTSLITSCNDDVRSSLASIGFTFVYEGANYTQFSVNSNGLMRLGGTQVSTANANGNFGGDNTDAPRIAPMWDDMHTAYNGWVRSMVTGTSPNRILKVDWRLISYSASSTDCFYNPNFSTQFQVWLYEGTNIIEFRYGAGVTQASYSVGISGSNGTNYLSVNASHVESNTTRTTNRTTWVGSGRLYRFSGCVAPSITSQPSATTVERCLNGTGFPDLSVSANGTTPTYQWYSNTTASNSGGTAVGTNAATYTPPNNAANDRYYYVVVSNSCGTVTSNVSGLQRTNSLPATPSITSNSPQCVGTGVTFTQTSCPGGSVCWWQTTSSDFCKTTLMQLLPQLRHKAPTIYG
jgi:hypothetical protein